jgi:hypothetical protein
VATIYELPQDESYEIQSKKYPDNRTFKVITAAQDETLTQILSTFKFTDQTTQADPTANWISYTSEKGKFSLSYPPGWVQPTHKEMCNPGLFDRALYLGPDDRSVLVCQSSYTGQMYVVSVEGDKRTDSSYNLSTGFANIQEQDVAVSGIVGQRTEATASGQWGEGSINDGTTVVHYLFYAYGRTYITSYIGAPHDVLKDFDSMVKTLTFMQ